MSSWSWTYSGITQEPDTNLYKPALEAIKDFIKTSTSSMTAVPKPLKFLRPHYEDLTKLYDEWPAGTDKVAESSVLLGLCWLTKDQRTRWQMCYLF